jgi:outer membrane protein OmpA-like peptidoglycan-associated protein
MHMKGLCRAVLVIALLAHAGCGYVHRPAWGHQWGKGTWIPALACGVVGAGAGIGIQYGANGCSSVRATNGEKRTACDYDLPQDAWQGALIGAGAGAAACALLGHILLDPTPEPTLPPPPPPPLPSPTPKPLPAPKKRIVLRGVTFDFNSAEIRADSRPILDQAVTSLGDNADVLVVVEGHTDSIGTEEINQALSLRRAESVFRYLVNRGVAPERLRIEGFGKSRPVATNDTEQGRAQNRRVELRVMP